MADAAPARRIHRARAGRQQGLEARGAMRGARAGGFEVRPGIAAAHDHRSPATAGEEAAHGGAQRAGTASGAGAERARLPGEERIEGGPVVYRHRQLQQGLDLGGGACPRTIGPARARQGRAHRRRQRAVATRDEADEAGDVDPVRVRPLCLRRAFEVEASHDRCPGGWGSLRPGSRSLRPTARSLPWPRRRRPCRPAWGRCTSSGCSRAAARCAPGCAPRP